MKNGFKNANKKYGSVFKLIKLMMVARARNVQVESIYITPKMVLPFGVYTYQRKNFQNQKNS